VEGKEANYNKTGRTAVIYTGQRTECDGIRTTNRSAGGRTRGFALLDIIVCEKICEENGVVFVQQWVHDLEQRVL